LTPLSITASRAYKQAMATLTTLTAHPPAHTFDPSIASASSNTQSIFSSLLPNLQGQGPIGSAFRIILKLQQHTARRLANSFGKETLKFSYKKKEDEIRDKAIKVIDLLQHSAELGNMDALYTLSQVSLVCSIVIHFPQIDIN
jgi:SEL1 protein